MANISLLKNLTKLKQASLERKNDIANFVKKDSF